MKTFAALGVASDLSDALAAAGIDTPFPIQALTIPDALAGRNVCGKAQTGSGKTLAFGLPIIMRTEQAKPQRPRALVLVPTRELAHQVQEVLAPLAAARGLRERTSEPGSGRFAGLAWSPGGGRLLVGWPDGDHGCSCARTAAVACSRSRTSRASHTGRDAARVPERGRVLLSRRAADLRAIRARRAGSAPAPRGSRE